MSSPEHRVSAFSTRGVRSIARTRGVPWAAAAGAVIVVLALAAYLYDHSRRDLIAGGVRIDGIDVGGLREASAREKLQRTLIADLRRPITVRSGSRTWHLGTREVGLTVDVRALVARAVRVSREGSIVSRTIRGLFGGSVNRNLALGASYSLPAVRRLTASIRGSVNRPARDAAVVPGANGLRETTSQTGLAVNSPRLGGEVEHAITGTGAARTVTVPTKVTKPAVTTGMLAARYPAYIIIDRSAFRLRFYRHLKLADTYEIAVGMQGLETPPGMYSVQWKQVDPPWYVPKKAWAGALAGTVVPPGPLDPLKARFMSFDGGAGIHGIDPSEYSTIGHYASHGCVRMRIPDVISLYARTPVGTPVYIV
ncbi:MAG TPA: L,D-transpeptidase family protein [Solirubrobacteraceae bacterium]|nr:L,D-transpeptidase family protein [Solirubrobacteraceae bacterium]